MKIELHKIPVRNVFEGYVNNQEDGVVGYGGKLDIRPPYQRNFVYKPAQRDEVVRTVMKNFPLNIMYWIDHGDGTYEVMDGQQRTISICDYLDSAFSIDNKFFHSLSDKAKNKILDYELMIYFCQGDDDEKLDWFKTVNIAGERLYDQEIRNAVYAGRFVSSAKKYFSRTNCIAYKIAGKYLNGSSIRQDYLETALKWITDREGCTMEEYMSLNHHNDDAAELINYFQDVVGWIEKIFIKYYKEMKGIEWGILYNKYGNNPLDIASVTARVDELMADFDVTSKKGIYTYILSGEEKYLNIRKFDERTRKNAYAKQHGKCAGCGKEFKLSELEADHITAWSKGGKTVPENCQLLCKNCNLKKSDR